MSWVSFTLFAALLIGSALAAEDVNSANEVSAEGEAEGRSCATCGSSSSTHTGSQVITSVLDKPDFSAFIPTGASIDPSGILGALGGLGSLGIGIYAIPILAVNIAVLVLLAIILAHIKSLGDYGDSGTGDVYHYSPVPSYVGGGSGHSSYQSYDSSASGYSKRSAKDARDFHSPSTFQFLTRMVSEAIEKYGKIDQGEE